MSSFEENEENQRMQSSGRRKRKGGMNGAQMVIVFVLACLVLIGVKLYISMPSSEAAFKYISNWEKGGISIILKDMAIPSEFTPIVEENTVYFSVEFVKAYIDDSIYWDNATQKLTITNAKNVIRMTTDELTYYVNNDTLQLDMPFKSINGSAYIPQEMLHTFYQISTAYNAADQIAIVDYDNEGRSVATIKDNRVKVYAEADKKSDVILKLSEDTEISIYDTEYDFTKIRTAEGVPGYVLTKVLLNEKRFEPTAQKEDVVSSEGWKPEKGNISMVWDQIFKVEANRNESRRIPMKGLNVTSPTWFALADQEGNVSNIADEEYVKWAHSQGYQVWALFSNSFDSKLSHEVLSNTDKREKVIKQILALAALYDIDGINIDFESIAEADGIHYVQFIREITPFLKAQGLTVSVDMYAPSVWTSHYDMTTVGKIVDYVAIMAYDEHWGTSPKSGSTASLGWTEKAIEDAVAMVDNKKIIMGVPFFTRLWEENLDEDGQLSVTSSAYGMQGGLNILSKNNVEPVYDETTGQYYGEYELEGVAYKIWIEDEQSLQKRLDIADKYEIAGVAGWKRGLEKDGTWDLIDEYAK